MPDTPPDWSGELRGRLAPLRLKPEREAEIVEELSQHLDDRYLEAIAGGAPHDEAVRAALAAFHADHALAQHMSTLRQANTAAPALLGAASGHPLTDLKHDLRYAARAFRKQRTFALTAVLVATVCVAAALAPGVRNLRLEQPADTPVDGPRSLGEPAPDKATGMA